MDYYNGPAHVKSAAVAVVAAVIMYKCKKTVVL